MVMKCVSALIPHCELWGDKSRGSSQREPGPWPRLHCVPLGLCVPQLGGSQVLNGQAGHTKLGKIAASFIHDTVYKQQVITCCMFYLFGSLLAKVEHRDPHIGQLASGQPSRKKMANIIETELDGASRQGAQPPTCVL